MYVLVIEFDRTRHNETRREKRYWTFPGAQEAEAAASPFLQLAHAGSTNFLRNGDKLSFQECRLYRADTDDHQAAKQLIVSGAATMLQHAFSTTAENPDYWEEVLDRLDHGEKLDN